MSQRVFISGMGIISALGCGVEQNISALVAGKTGIALPQHLNTSHKTEMVTGEVKLSNQQLSVKAGLPENSKLSRTALLGLIAAKEAIQSSGLKDNFLNNINLINGTSVGGMDVTEKFYADFKSGKIFNFRDAFLGHDCGASTEFIAKQLSIQGQISTISTACSSSANAIMQATRLIKSKRAECVIAGGTDALSLFTLNGFNALKILDPSLCKPFDKYRSGLNLGEGAAYVVLESEEQLRKRKGNVIAEITGYGNANDAFHQTASSPEGKGAYLAMKQALKITGSEIIIIDYINAHGTGTANNDLSEITALHSLFNESLPDYSSTKSYTGHTLGAAGAIEAVFSLFAIQKNLKFPNLNFKDSMDTDYKTPLRRLKESSSVKTVLSNSFGFGGNCTSLIFSNAGL